MQKNFHTTKPWLLVSATALLLAPAMAPAQIAEEANEVSAQAQEVAQDANALADDAATMNMANDPAMTTTTTTTTAEDPLVTDNAAMTDPYATQDTQYVAREEEGDGFPWGLLGLLGLAGLLGRKKSDRDIHVDNRTRT